MATARKTVSFRSGPGAHSSIGLPSFLVHSIRKRRSHRNGAKLLTAHSVAISVQFTRIAGFASKNWCGAGGAGG